MNSSAPTQDPPVLRQYLPGFRLHLKSEGYSAETIRVYLICLGALDRTAAAAGLDLETLAERHVNGLPLAPPRGGKPLLTNGFPALLGYLARRKLLVPRGREAQIAHLLARFRRFLIDEAGRSVITADIHGRLARRFLTHRFKTGEVQTQDITSGDVVAFLSLPNHHHQYLANGLKSLLRYLFQKGLIGQPLADGIPSMRRHDKRRLPRSMSPERMQALLAGLPVATPTQRRNKAMMTLMYSLGLRAGEVMRLTLDDINWEAGTVLIHGKGRYEAWMPFPEEPARLVFAYITQDRPASKSRAVFLTERAPHNGITRSSLPVDLRKLLRNFGVPSHTGSRVFRHSFATHMVTGGAAIADVSNAMRHRSVTTTMVYARTDLARLRETARPWPFSAREVGA